MGHILEWQTAVHLQNVAALSKSQTDFPKKGKQKQLQKLFIPALNQENSNKTINTFYHFLIRFLLPFGAIYKAEINDDFQNDTQIYLRKREAFLVVITEAALGAETILLTSFSGQMPGMGQLPTKKSYPSSNVKDVKVGKLDYNSHLSCLFLRRNSRAAQSSHFVGCLEDCIYLTT